MPLSRWLREEPLRGWLAEALSRPELERLGLNTTAARSLMQEHQDRKADHGRALWALAVVSEWIAWLDRTASQTDQA